MKLSLLLTIAILTLAAFFAADVYSFETATAQPGKIIAASELSKSELKIIKANAEKQTRK